MAQHDLGELGPRESAALSYSWRFVDNLSGVAVWALLVAAIVLLKENRNPKALLILVPLIAVVVLWMGIKFLLGRFAGMPSLASAMFDALVTGFAVGLAVVLLIAGRLQRTNRFAIVLLAWAVMAAAFAASLIGSRGLIFDWEAIQLSIFYGVMAVAAILALVIAGLFCRRRFGAGKFMFWLGVWCVLLCAGTLFLAALTVALIQQIRVWDQIGEFLLVGGIMGIIVYLFLLPFVIFALRSDLYRERFYACFRRRGMPACEVAAEAETPHDWRTS